MSAFPNVDRALAAGDVRSAYDVLVGAATQGNTAAFFELALWFLEGRLVRRDLARSREFFIEAAKRGSETAASVAAAFLSVGVGGDRDWAAAMQWLNVAARHDPLLARELPVIENMRLSHDGEPSVTPGAEVVHNDPAIKWVRGFLTHEECDLLIDKARPMLAPSVIIDPSTGVARPDPVRTSHNAPFPWANETPFIHAVNRRIAHASGSAVECGEPLQVLRYAGGQEYRRHSDAIGGESNQRVMTALIYLNEGYDGGETDFPELGLSLKGNRGDLLLFANTLPDGRAHPLSAHLGRPARRGEKWLASRWIRQMPFGSLR